MLGTLIKVDIIWELADTFNGFMCLPNLIALWLLQNQVLQLKDKWKALWSQNY